MGENIVCTSGGYRVHSETPFFRPRPSFSALGTEITIIIHLGKGKEVGLKYFRLIYDALLTRPGAAPIEGAVSSQSFSSPRPRQRSKSTTPTSEGSDSSTPLLSRELVDKLARRTFATEDTFEMSR